MTAIAHWMERIITGVVLVSALNVGSTYGRMAATPHIALVVIAVQNADVS